LVSISGGQKSAVPPGQPTALAAYELSLGRARRWPANVNQAKGNFDGAHQAYTIGANDQRCRARPRAAVGLPVSPVRLSDVADVTDDGTSRGGVDEHALR
jgi:multidrug efflux pump